jgi:hypothetical protein
VSHCGVKKTCRSVGTAEPATAQSPGAGGRQARAVEQVHPASIAMQGPLPGADIRLPFALIVQPRLDEGHPEGAVMMPQGVSQLFGIEVGEQEAEAPGFATTRRRQQRDPTHLRRHDHRIIGDFFIRCFGNAQLDGFAFLRDDAASLLSCRRRFQSRRRRGQRYEEAQMGPWYVRAFYKAK